VHAILFLEHIQSCHEVTQPGAYAIGGELVYCNSDGWQLAMQFSNKSNFLFDSPYWTDSNLLGNPGEAPTNTDGKYSAFNNLPVYQIKLCFHACVTLEVPQSHSGKTLHQLFNEVSVGREGLGFDGGVADFRAAVGLSGGSGYCWNKVKINFDDVDSNYKCRGRLALIQNNECSSVTANDAIGVGVTEANGASTGSGITIFPGHVTNINAVLWVRSKGMCIQIII
jgi:hypothetical protein